MTHDPTPRLERRDSFVHRVSDSIRYRDQDPGGHVNNTAFSHFVESGRVAYNLDCIARGEDAGARFTVARVAIDYRAEARHPGTVETGTRVLAVGARSYVVGSGLFVGDTCIATAESVTVHLRDGRPAVMPEALRRRLEGLSLDAAMPARPAPPEPPAAWPVEVADVVRFSDQDPNGHVNNTVYFAWVEHARVALIHRHLFAGRAPGERVVAARVAIDFLHETAWPADIRIGARVSRVGRSSFDVACGVYRDGGQVARAATTMVYQRDGRSEPLAPAQRAVLEGLAG